MNDEELQRKMEFIIEHQAQFAVDIQSLRESQAEIVRAQAEAQQRVDERMSRMEDVVLHLAGVVERVVEVQEQTVRTVADTVRAVAETDERLNSLINVVERFISEGRNGKQQG